MPDEKPISLLHFIVVADLLNVPVQALRICTFCGSPETAYTGLSLRSSYNEN